MIDYNTRLLYTMKYFGPLTMRYRFRMKDPVDGDVLDSAVQKTMRRYPYLAKKTVVRNGAYVLEENPLKVPVFETVSPMPAFGSEEMNGHLICGDYKGNDICLAIAHNLGGGRGLFNWCFSVLYQYVWDKYGVDPKWEGVRRPDLPPEPGEELLQPLEKLPEIPKEWKGFPDEVKPYQMSRLEEELNKDEKGKKAGYYFSIFSLDGDKVMQRVRGLNASPSVWFAVIYYRALIRCLSEVPEFLDMGITCDVSPEYGFSESMSLITKFLHFVISKDDAGQDNAALCRKGREMLKLQRDPGATNELLKKERDTLIEMEKLPGIDEKAEYYLKHSLIADMPPSALVSYVGRYDIPGLEEYVEEYTVAGVNNTNGLVITAPKGRFMAEIAHKYEDAALISAFKEELLSEGITPLKTEVNIEQNNLGIILP